MGLGFGDSFPPGSMEVTCQKAFSHNLNILTYADENNERNNICPGLRQPQKGLRQAPASDRYFTDETQPDQLQNDESGRVEEGLAIITFLQEMNYGNLFAKSIWELTR